MMGGGTVNAGAKKGRAFSRAIAANNDEVVDVDWGGANEASKLKKGMTKQLSTSSGPGKEEKAEDGKKGANADWLKGFERASSRVASATSGQSGSTNASKGRAYARTKGKMHAEMVEVAFTPTLTPKMAPKNAPPTAMSPSSEIGGRKKAVLPLPPKVASPEVASPRAGSTEGKRTRRKMKRELSTDLVGSNVNLAAT